jgi:DNA-binding response OmpR family regulator
MMNTYANYYVSFTAKGCEVVPVNDGAEAVQAASTSIFDLCILDFEMPHMDGLQACFILRKTPHTAKLPILFLTSRTDTPTIEKVFKEGASDYLSKPFNRLLLWHRFNLLLRLADLTQQNRSLDHVLNCLENK